MLLLGDSRILVLWILVLVTRIPDEASDEELKALFEEH